MASMTQEATRIGLSLADRISNSGLEWIRMRDYDLYCDIMNRRNGIIKKRRRTQ